MTEFAAFSSVTSNNITWLVHRLKKLGAKVVATFSSDQTIGSTVDLHQFRVKCLEFFIGLEGAHQIYQRFSFKLMNHLKKLEFLNPEKVYSKSINIIADVFPHYPHNIFENEYLDVDS
ncbi:hypothetical protein PR048_021001 [Dryococelus australis]|uniref:Uncharacterized protein n=1 Tax=Dryococelus australis TaxID=614101 RepID=A0ABQ9GX04_9NEOP|nr:hypothetical protein PR048_021001 [Dryococelus australis]